MSFDLYTGRLHQAANIPEHERKGLASARIALNNRHMIGHQHAIVAHFFVNMDCFQHVDVARIGECLLELQESAVNVSEMHVEDLLPRSEIANHVEDLRSGALEHFRDSSLAEI